MYDVNRQRQIVKDNMPFKNEALRLSAANTRQVGETILTQYRTSAVPTLGQQEESGVNEGFIREKTVGEINTTLALQARGITANVKLSNDTLVRLGIVQRINTSMR